MYRVHGQRPESLTTRSQMSGVGFAWVLLVPRLRKAEAHGLRENNPQTLTRVCFLDNFSLFPFHRSFPLAQEGLLTLADTPFLIPFAL